MTKEMLKCRRCGSPEIGAGSFNPDLGGGWRIVDCDTCGYQWIEVFELIYNTDMDGNILDEEEN